MSYERTTAKYYARIIKVEKVGVKKEIDKLGRICIPKEMRKLFNFEKEVELLVTKEGILIKNPEYVLVKKQDENL